MPYDALTKTAA